MEVEANATVLVVSLANLALIGALPRIFFRKGTFNLAWWLTAAPFLVAAATVACGALGFFAPVFRPSMLLEVFAALAATASVGFIGFTLGTHQEPLSLWHQAGDSPQRLVTHGAYAWIRHPFYAAFIVGLFAALLAMPHWMTLGAFVAGFYRLNQTAAREEQRLLDSPFGAAYSEYLGRTGRFVPPIRGAPVRSFRAKRVEENAGERRHPDPSVPKGTMTGGRR